jgi:hypothetical protein
VSDLAVIVDSELMVAHVEGLSDPGADFLDAYVPDHECL